MLKREIKLEINTFKYVKLRELKQQEKELSQNNTFRFYSAKSKELTLLLRVFHHHHVPNIARWSVSMLTSLLRGLRYWPFVLIGWRNRPATEPRRDIKVALSGRYERTWAFMFLFPIFITLGFSSQLGVISRSDSSSPVTWLSQLFRLLGLLLLPTLLTPPTWKKI